MKSYKFASQRQAIGALAKAPLVPVALMFLMDAFDRTLHLGPLAIVGAAILAIYILIAMEILSLVVGGAILAMTWKWLSFNILLASVLGGTIAILPSLALVLADPVAGLNASVNDSPTVVDGQKTSYGLSRDMETLAVVFTFGLIGGASFWWFGRPEENNRSNNSNDR